MDHSRALAVLPWLAIFTAQGPLERLGESPRHHEWVEIERGGGRSLHAFVAYPEAKAKAGAVLVIHENKGLTDWVRAVADRLAEAGLIAIAPDLLSGAGPDGGRTDSFASSDAATKGLYALDAGQVSADLDAAAEWALGLPACDGKLSVVGFCWGGSRAFELATNRRGLKAAFVFYGSAPTGEAALARIECPVYGFYGESDARINATLPATLEAMGKLGKTFEPRTYPGAGHGFLRAGESAGASEANKQAMQDAWARLRKLLES